MRSNALASPSFDTGKLPAFMQPVANNNRPMTRLRLVSGAQKTCLENFLPLSASCANTNRLQPQSALRKITVTYGQLVSGVGVGQYADSETGLSYNFFRDYNPSLGRFVESDPIGLQGGINTYGYVGGNPVTGIDPYGLQEVLPPTTLFGRLPPWLENLPANVLDQLKETIPELSGKEGAKDAPSWCKGQRPMIKENGSDFAKRLLDDKYGPGNWKEGPGTEYNKIKKWGDRNFRVPSNLSPDTA